MKFAPGQSVGRPKGLAEVRELARQHSPQAIEMLAHIMANGESEQARIAAANSILDRAWGKASQAHTGESGEGPVTQITRIFVEPGHQNGVRCLLLALRDRQQRLALRPVLEVLRTRIEVSPRSLGFEIDPCKGAFCDRHHSASATAALAFNYGNWRAQGRSP